MVSMMLKNKIKKLLVASLLITTAPLTYAHGADSQTLSTLKDSKGDKLTAKQMLFRENPGLLKAVAKGGAFGGEFSAAIAYDIFGRSEQAVNDAKRLGRIEEVAPRTWMLYLPIVNAVLFETDEGLILVDTGMNAAGEAIKSLIKSVSNKPIHTIIYTHCHVDHAYGTWALMENKPQVIAQKELPKCFDRYYQQRGSLAKYLGQPLSSLPRSKEDFVYPTKTFDKKLTITVGGENFELRAHRGETDDQLYVYAPNRDAIATADYYQGFLPNAGNGKRLQRYPGEWADALLEMASENPTLLLPAHGLAIKDPALIKENLTVLANALNYIVEHTKAQLNKGMRKDLIPATLKLPKQYKEHPTLNEQYVSPQDISKMVIKLHTGWWDDIPSHWSPAPLKAQYKEIVRLAGGVDIVAKRARELAPTDIKMALHLTDYLWYSQPENPKVQELLIEIYRQRVLAKGTNTMEMVNYLKEMIKARTLQLEQKS